MDLLDPYGLAAATQPSGVDFTGNMIIPFDPVGINDPFSQAYLNSANWGQTDPTGDWKRLQDGRYKHDQGAKTTKLLKLVLPPKLAPCLEAKRTQLQAEVDRFNERARQHEQSVQQWYNDYCQQPRTGNLDQVKSDFVAAHKYQFGDSPWELSEQIDMYTLLRNVFANCDCNDSDDSTFEKIDKKIQNLQKLIEDGA